MWPPSLVGRIVRPDPVWRKTAGSGGPRLGRLAPVPRSNLTLDEARRRARQVAEPEYEVHLDLTGEERFRAETVIRFRCAEPGTETFLDCAEVEVVSAELNGRP